ncbi:response regulator transcription factor [Streptomyces sp. NPDC091281]|uniref:response regulator transcription factor n=1 Tax=Streptomyces sp. NPDC091281 TaxID=3365985 RepID=UPI0037F91B4B
MVHMAGESSTFPWARVLRAPQLAAFIDDLWGAASGDDGLATLDAVEEVIEKHRPDNFQPPYLRCPLTARQLAILTEIAKGGTHETAAKALHIPVATATSRCRSIYDLLGVPNSTAAVAVAARYGWLTDIVVPDTSRWLYRRAAKHWLVVHRQAAGEMRAKPGQPVSVGPYMTRQGATQAVRRIESAALDPYKPAGSFAAEAFRDDNSLWHVRARYLGTADSPSIQPGDQR